MQSHSVCFSRAARCSIKAPISFLPSLNEKGDEGHGFSCLFLSAFLDKKATSYLDTNEVILFSLIHKTAANCGMRSRRKELAKKKIFYATHTQQHSRLPTSSCVHARRACRLFGDDMRLCVPTNAFPCPAFRPLQRTRMHAHDTAGVHCIAH